MKILITTDWYSPAVNGVVTSVKNLRRGLEARGHEVRILTLSQTTHSWTEDGVTYLGSVPAGLVYPGARLRTPMVRRWTQELVAWGPDVVHSQCEFSTFFLARRIAEYLDVPLVHTYHTVYEDYTHYFSPSVRFGKKAVAMFSRWVAAQTDCLIAPTVKVRQLLQGYGISRPVFVVPSGIDLDRFSGETDPIRQAVLRQSLDIPQEHLILVSVGRLAEEKNLEELLHLRAAMGEAPVTLLLVGGGPDKLRLEGIAAGLGLTAPALCRADPCLAGVIREGENGWQYRDREEFQQKLTEIRRQPEQLAEMSAAARRSMQTFSIHAFAEHMESIYLSQMAHHGGGRQEVSA